MRTIRHLGCLAGLVLLCVWSIGCGPASTLCFSDGQCAFGETCYNNACVSIKKQACLATCTTGCCQDGQCVQPSNLACGIGGKACENCAALGMTCNVQAGACQPTTNPPQGACGPQTCEGCCANGICKIPDSSFCGRGGVVCTNCGSGTCNTETGICEGGTPSICGPQNCLNGCCQNGQCITQLNASACGSGGDACVACQDGQTCHVGSGRCEGGGGGSVCNASTCPGGCCQNGLCITTLSDGACGTGGNACYNCAANNQVCDTGTGSCQNKTASCGPDTCAGGCCQNGQCITTLSESACGKGGIACGVCGATQVCDTNAGQCIAKQVNYPPGPYGSALQQTFPEYAFSDCNGNGVTSKNDIFNKKKVHLFVVSTGTRCPACMKETSHLISNSNTYSVYRDQNLQIWYLYAKATCDSYTNTLSANPNIRVLTMTQALLDRLRDDAFVGSGVPVNFIVTGKDMKVQYKAGGYSEKTLKTKVGQLLAAP